MYGVPDSFALMMDSYIVIQYKKKKIIQVYDIQNNNNEIHLTLENCISRNGKSFCVYSKFMAVRNMKLKCFEVVDILKKEKVL